VEFDNSDFIEYTYTATGTKLRKTVTSWKTTTGGKTDYAGQFLYQDNELSCIFTPVGRIVPMQYNDETFWKHEYNLKDHLGNTRIVFAAHPHGQPELMQQTSYYPFGMTLQQQNFGGSHNQPNKLLYNGKELQDDELAGVSLDWYDYGARMYDAQIGRFTTSDPLAEVAYDWTPYRYGFNNPVIYIDPTGMLESTHTDEDGNVLAVYDDGDNGVYKHAGKGDEAAKNVENNYSADNTSAGGEKMGESLHSLSFADQSLHNETGEVKAADIKIDYGSTELTDKVQGILDADPSLKEYAGKAGTNGDWDLKSNTSNGSKLFGKYASPRDAGNFAAGAVAQKSSFTGIAQFGYGAYNLSGNSKVKTVLITGAVGALTLANPALGLGAGYLIGKFGEDKLSQRSIDIGKQYIKDNK
jgi:RHS repeat-associated protein